MLTSNLRSSLTRQRNTRRSVSLTATAVFLAVLLGAAPSFATASFDFVSSAGQFTIAGGTLDFGNGLTISSASQDGSEDSALINAVVLLDSIMLDGSTTPLAGGLTQIGVDTSIDYTMQIFQAPEDGGALIMSAIYDPGEFLVIGASGLISAPIVDALSSITVNIPAFSAVLDELGETGEAIDFNATLSAAGQDLASRIASGSLVAGSVAGSVATVIPEPTTAILMGLGLTGLALVSRREAQRD